LLHRHSELAPLHPIVSFLRINPSFLSLLPYTDRLYKPLQPSDFDVSEKGGSCFLPGNPSLSLPVPASQNVRVDASRFRSGVQSDEHGEISPSIACTAPEEVLPQTLRMEKHVSEQDHIQRNSGHPGTTSMFRFLRRRYFWRNPVVKNATMVRQRAVCANKSIYKWKKTCFLKLLPARFAEDQAMCKDLFDRSVREKCK
jgi:hypothetical protein